MKVAFSVYRTILSVCVIAYVLVAIAPMFFRMTPYMVLSASMEPTIKTGALCYINRDRDATVGDIVAFEVSDGTTVVHRIHGLNDDGTFVTKGDNNDSVDFVSLNPENIVGTVKYSVPYVGYVTGWLQSKTGIVITVSLILISLVSSIATDIQTKKKETTQ